MSRFLAARISRIERRRERPNLVRNTVAAYRPDGTLIGPAPKGPHIRFTSHGTDEQWAAACRAQQERLIEQAYSAEQKRNIAQ